MKNIELNDKDYKLLMVILKNAEEERSDMGCNDPYKKEEKIYTKKERIEMQKTMWGQEIDEEDIDGFLFNSDYVQHIINKIKEQNE